MGENAVIWDFVEEELKCQIPVYFKNILHVCGYTNAMTIASIDEDDIKYFEDEMKNGNVRNHYKGLKEEDVLMGSNKDSKNFEFSRGHVKFLMAIRDVIKKQLDNNGPDFFGLEKGAKEKPVVPKEKSMKRKRSTMEHRDKQYAEQNKNISEVIREHRKIISTKCIKKLIEVTPSGLSVETKRRISIDFVRASVITQFKPSEGESRNDFELKCKNESGDSSENDSDSSQRKRSGNREKLVADVRCPLCPIKRINVFHKPSKKNVFLWNTSNWNRHLKETHNLVGTAVYINDNREKNDKDLISAKDETSLAFEVQENDLPANRAKKSEKRECEPKIDSVPDDYLQDNSDSSDGEIEISYASNTNTVLVSSNKLENNIKNGIHRKKLPGNRTKMSKENECEPVTEEHQQNNSDSEDGGEDIAYASNTVFVKTNGQSSTQDIIAEKCGQDGRTIVRHEPKFPNHRLVSYSDSNEDSDEEVTFNGRGLHESKSKLVPSNCTSSASVDGIVAISLLRNGHTSVITSNNCKRTISTYNTCGFDSLLFIYTSLYCDDPCFRGSFFGQSKFGTFIKEYVDTFNHKNQSTANIKKMYDERNVLLKDMFTLKFYSKSKNMKKNGDIENIDCSTGIGGFFGQLCLEMCSNIGSAVETKTCGKCGTATGIMLPLVSVFPIDLDLANVQTSLRLYSSKNRSCKDCKSRCTMKRVFNNVVALEVEPDKGVSMQRKISIKKISQMIDLGKDFKLYALIQFDPKLRHFKSYIKRMNDEWVICDDLCDTEKKIKETEEVLPYMLFYLKIDYDNEYQDALKSLLPKEIKDGKHKR